MIQQFDPLQSSAPLIVYLDIKSPYAFAAKDPTYALADKLDIDIDWRPLTLDIPSYLGSAKLDKKGKVEQSNRTPEQWGGVRYAYMDARRYAAAWGYGLRGTEKIWDTRLIHLALMWVKRTDPGGRKEVRAFLDAVYPRFWLRDLDVEDLGVVIAQIEAAGVSPTGFAQWADGEGGVEHDSQQAAIFAAGIYGVPGYIHNRQYFFGREHLPPLQQALTGGDSWSVDVGYPLPAPETLASLGNGKHAVFLDMRRAASAGELRITAAVNADCLQTHLALKTIEEIQSSHPGKLSVTYAQSLLSKEMASEVAKEAATEVAPTDIDPVLHRGDAHRAFRSRYRLLDTQRYANWRSAQSDTAVAKRFDAIALDAAAANDLLSAGIGESFGFVYVDKDGVSHPFNGRAHLLMLRWALERG